MNRSTMIKRLKKIIRKRDQLLRNSSVSDISETSNLIYAGVWNSGKQRGTMVMLT